MKTVLATSLTQAFELLASGKYPEIELDFDINADDFFNLTTNNLAHDVKIIKRHERFIIKIRYSS